MLERRLRLWTGLILAAYVISHFVNHSLGLASLDAMEAYRRVNALVWQSWPGTIALYGCFLVHALLALYSLFRRTTLRMPWWEATQLVLGLLIPPLIAIHVIGTRLGQSVLGFDVEDRDGDGEITMGVHSPAGAPDTNTILSVLWLFESGRAPADRDILAGKADARAVAGADTDSIRHRMSLPDDVSWSLRNDGSSAYLDEDLPIGDQVEPGDHLTITPKTHLAARGLRVG